MHASPLKTSPEESHFFPNLPVEGKQDQSKVSCLGLRVKGLKEGMEEGAASSHKRLQRALASPNWLHTA